MYGQSVADRIANATCAVLDDDGRVQGTAWLFSWSGHLLTAGHLIDAAAASVPVRFGSERAIDTTPLFRVFDEESGVDFAVLKAETTRERPPLPLALDDAPTGQFQTFGYGRTLVNGSSASGQFVGFWDRQDSVHGRLLKVSSDQLEAGFSGSAIFSSELNAVVGLQVSATTATTGPESSTAFAMPLYRVERLWPDLIIEAHRRLKLDLAFAPEVEHLYGRLSELQDLTEAIFENRANIVAIVGMAGIGKTSLVASLVAERFPENGSRGAVSELRDFDYVQWHSLTSSPSFNSFISDLVSFLTDESHVDGLSETQAISLAVRLMQERSTLIILDNFDSVLTQGASGVEYRDGYEAYGEFVRAIGSVTTISTVCLTTRELPRDLASVARTSGRIQVLHVGGVDQAAATDICLLQADLEGAPHEWGELSSRYGGNPLALQLAALHIMEVFDASLPDFLSTQASVLPDLRLLLDWHLARLSEHEKELLYWLAINQIPSTLDELRSDLLTSTSKAALPSTIQTLRQRTVVERADLGFFLQPVLIEYANERLVEELEGRLAIRNHRARNEILSSLSTAVADDIESGGLTLLNRHALLKATSRSDVRDGQRALLVGPLFQRLSDALGGADAVERHCGHVLDELREGPGFRGYAAGNIFNLLATGGCQLKGVDFSELAIWQAVLDNADGRDLNFSGSNFDRTIFRGSFGAMLTVAWSPDDSLLAGGSANQEILVWDASNRQLVKSLVGHTDWVRALEFLSESEIVSAGDDGTIRLWNLEKDSPSQILNPPGGSTGWIRALAVDREQRRLIAGAQDGSALVVDIDQRAVLAHVAAHSGPCLAVDYDHPSSLVVTAGADGLLQRYAVEDGELIQVTAGRAVVGEACYAVSLHSNGTVLAGTATGHLVEWDPDTAEVRRIDLNFLRPIRDLDDAGDGLSSWVTCSDGIVRSVMLGDGAVRQSMRGHRAAVNAVRLSSDRTQLASASDDQTVRVWDRASGQCSTLLAGYSGGIRSVTALSGRRAVSLGEDRALRFWDIGTGQQTTAISGIEELSWPLAVSSRPREAVLTCSTDGALRIFDDRQVISTIPAHRGPLRVVTTATSAPVAATGGADHAIRIWDTETWTQTRVISHHTDWVRSLAFTPGGETLASGADDGSLMLWDTATGAIKGALRTTSEIVHCLSTDHTDPRLLVSGDEVGRIQLWDLSDGSLVNTWMIEGSGRAVAIDSSAGYIIAGGFGGDITVWDLNADSTDPAFRYTCHDGWVRSIAIADPVKGLVLSSDSTGTIHEWEVSTDQPRKVLRADRPYERTVLTNSNGLETATVETLRALGAIL